MGLWLTGLFGDPDTTDNLDGSWDHENVAAVMEHYPAGERFFQEFTLRQVLLNAAKNGLGPSAAGTSSQARRMGAGTSDPTMGYSSEGPNTAAPAATRASPVPEAIPEPAAEGEELRVQTEFGADMWTWPLRAGFAAVTVTTTEYPAALAVTGWKGRPQPIAQAVAGEVSELRGELPAIQTSRSWSASAGLRRLSAFLRR